MIKSKLLSTTINLQVQLPPNTPKTRLTEQIIITLLNSHCNTFPKLTQIHAFILKTGLQNNPLVLTKFTSTSSNLNSIHYATSFLFPPPQTTPTPTPSYDAFLFNTVICSYSQTRDSKSNSLVFYRTMLRYGVSPNKFTFPFVLKACAGIGSLRLGKCVHGCVVKFGFEEDVHVLNTLIHMYCCGGEDGFQFAEKVFDDSPKMDTVTWSAMIGGFVRLGWCARAVGLFREMQVMGVCPDEITMVSVLSACADLGALELGKWVESYIEKKNIPKSMELCNALIDMFAKCGNVDKAIKLFRQMDSRTIVSWTSVIAGLAMHGRGVDAVSLFDEMVENGITPDDVAFVGVLSACSHSGLVDKGRYYFNSMERNFSIVPKVEHYGCMVDLLCRGGLVKEAFEFVQKMPFEPTAAIWGSLLGACRVHSNVDIGEFVGQRLLEIEPGNAGNYVILSNLYASAGRWEDVTSLRDLMLKKTVTKEPGRSWIELDQVLHTFHASDRSHPRREEICVKVKELSVSFKEFGYVPDLSCVLHDVDEEQKEKVLLGHSEKLALSFGLIASPASVPIRVIKNLRICVDCHNFAKYISKVYGREVSLRDKNRFHRIVGGKCSCGDYW